MGFLTASLFVGEFIFSNIKSLLLNFMSSRGRLVRQIVGALAGICFIIESLLGLALAFRLAYEAWTSKTMLKHKIALQVGVFLILGTEFLAIFTEARLIYAKIRKRQHPTSLNAHKTREVMKCISFVAGTVALAFTLIFIGLSKNSLLLNHSVAAICIAAIFLSANIALMILAYAMPGRVHMRAIANLMYMSLGLGFTLVVQFGAWYSDQGTSFSLDLWVTIAVFCSSISSACTALGACGLGDIQQNEGLDKSHAQLIEIAALGMTGPAVSMAFAVTNGLSARNILLTVFPQVLAILLPFVFSYGSYYFRQCGQQNENQGGNEGRPENA